MNSWYIDFYALDQSRENCLDFTLYGYPSCFSFVLLSGLTICDCLGFIEGLMSVLWHVSTKISVFVLFGMSQAGLAQNIVARHFGVHRNTILSLLSRFRQSGNTRDRQHSSLSLVTSCQQDNHISLVNLRAWFETSSLAARNTRGLRLISYRTVRSRLRDRHIRPRRPAIRPTVLPGHRAARLACCWRHLRFRRQDWANILFTDESSFHLDSSDSDVKSRVYRRIGESYADACVIQCRSYGGGSLWCGEA